MPFLTDLSAAKVQTAVQNLFGGNAALESLPTADMWALLAPLVYRSEKYNVTITLPIGMTSDLASTPKILQWVGFLDDDGVSRPAGLTHDGLYRLGRNKGKAWCDDLLREMCSDVGMKPWQAAIYYWAVRLFGNSDWLSDGGRIHYGDPRKANFISQADYDAWVASGATIYKEE